MIFTLRANAVFSLVSGLMFLLIPDSLNQIIGLGSAIPLSILGFILVLFSGLVWWVSSEQKLNKSRVRFIIIQDLMWVLGSLFVIIVNPFGMLTGGLILTGIIAIVVADFGYFQYMFVNRTG